MVIKKYNVSEWGLLTPREVARLLNVHPNTVKRISFDSLPFYRISTRGDRRYSVEDVHLYLDRGFYGER